MSAPGPLRYREPHETRDFAGLAAVAKLLNHGNALTALGGAGLLLLVLPLQACATAATARPGPFRRRRSA